MLLPRISKTSIVFIFVDVCILNILLFGLGYTLIFCDLVLPIIFSVVLLKGPIQLLLFPVQIDCT